MKDNEQIKAVEASPTVDPLALFLSDPDSHLSDVLYLYFRIYKKKLLWDFFQTALSKLPQKPSETFRIADIGASMGFDVLYLLRKLSRNFTAAFPFARASLSLIEGDRRLVEEGESFLQAALGNAPVDFKYYDAPLVMGIPLADASQDLALCSEVVEHLEKPELLLKEIQRILRPGGFFILTTDNSPNLLQMFKRIPVFLRGQYGKAYARPSLESETVGTMTWEGRTLPIYGHINLNPTRVWEKLCLQAGFEIVSFGTYESIRRGGGAKSPFLLASYFSFGAIVYHLMPRWLGRYFGDSTALLLRKAQNA